MSWLPQLSDYAWVHVKFTIPPALILSAVFRPLLTGIDYYKISFLVVIAVLTTIPWDSYLIHNGVWTYPEDAVLPGRIFKIPLEEVFFFFIQTYNTSLIYIFLSKATFYPAYIGSHILSEEKTLTNVNATFQKWTRTRSAGILVCLSAIIWATSQASKDTHARYFALILVWATPFILLLWTLSYNLVLSLPLGNTLVPISIPTLYLWIVDTLALQRGTWAIADSTKCGIFLWHGLEIEEALFFLITNVMIVLGLLAFDNALAVLHAFPDLFPQVPRYPSPWLLIQALLVPSSHYDVDRVQGLTDARDRLKRKSRSFSLASGAFEGRLRIDLVLLYSFCRTVDDLIDEAENLLEARNHLKNIHDFLALSYDVGSIATNSDQKPARLLEVVSRLPPNHQSAFTQLPTRYLPRAPLEGLLHGMKTDLEFGSSANDWPIKLESDLERYAHDVAGTVAELCICLIYHHSEAVDRSKFDEILQQGMMMGAALQYINIARDIEVDALISRVYIPSDWLEVTFGLSPEAVLKRPSSSEVDTLRNRLLGKAMLSYRLARPAIELLPPHGRAAIRVSVESYVEIGRILRKRRKTSVGQSGRATVPIFRRLFVAWRALNEG